MSTMGTIHRAPTAGTAEQFGKLPSIIGAFKAAVTRQINKGWDTPGALVWQRNDCEHV
jgi:hypothetical protein